MIGQTTVNSANSPESLSQSIEYRRGIARYVDWTIAWLNEGDNRLIRRNGILSQAWLVRAFLDEQLALGVGLVPTSSLTHTAMKIDMLWRALSRCRRAIASTRTGWYVSPGIALPRITTVIPT
jgi:hypothetical protein